MKGAGLLFQLPLQGDEKLRAENIPEDLLTFHGICLQKLPEIALGDHGYLGKLIPGQTDDLPDSLVHILQFGHHGPVGIGKHRFRLPGGGAGAPGLGPLIFRIAADTVFFPVVGEGQFHISGVFRFCIFGAEHAGFPVFSAGFSEEGEGDGIKNGGLARTGITGDQIQAVLSQFFKVQFLNSGIGAETGDCQFQRSHTLPSQMDSINSRLKLRCSSLMG